MEAICYNWIKNIQGVSTHEELQGIIGDVGTRCRASM